MKIVWLEGCFCLLLILLTKYIAIWLEWQNENKRIKQTTAEAANSELLALAHTKCDYERNEEVTTENAKALWHSINVNIFVSVDKDIWRMIICVLRDA